MHIKLFVFLFLQSLLLACNSIEEPRIEAKKVLKKKEAQKVWGKDAVKRYKVDLGRDNKTISQKFKRGAHKTILEFPTRGTETNLTIWKKGGAYTKLDYFFGDTSSLNQFVIVTDSSNNNKLETYHASYISCSQSGKAIILIE